MARNRLSSGCAPKPRWHSARIDAIARPVNTPLKFLKMTRCWIYNLQSAMGLVPPRPGPRQHHQAVALAHDRRSSGFGRDHALALLLLAEPFGHQRLDEQAPVADRQVRVER